MKADARHKIFKPYSFLIAGSVVLVMLILFWIVSVNNRRIAIYQQQEILHSDVVSLNEVFNRMHLIASQVNSSNELLSMFVQLEGDEDLGNYFDVNLMDSISASSVLETVNRIYSSMMRIAVYTDSGDFISAGLVCADDEVVQKMIQPELVPALSEYVLENSGKSSGLSGPHPDWWADNDEMVISYITRLTSVYAKHDYGYIEVDMEYDAIRALDFMQESDDGAYYILLDDFGRTGDNPSGDDYMDMTTLREALLAEQNAASDMVHIRHTVNGVKSDVLATRIGEIDWMLVRVLPNRTMLKPYLPVYSALLLGAIALLCVLFLIAYSMAGRVARPLHEFADSIDKITLGNMTMPKLPENRMPIDELVTLNRSFRRMLQKLNSAIGLEMQAYLKALQSQMDPHFLYNMLTVMSETADTDGSKHTVEMCQRLSKMLRYMANYENNQVTLRDEVDQLRVYLELMHDRYDMWFSFYIHEEAAMMNITVPKMILQPLAENCFQHGFKKVRPPWHVKVNMELNERAWMVSISDNGGGITEEEIAGIYKRINDFTIDAAAHYQQMRIGGLGMFNTIVRMRLAKGDGILFRIENLPERGTKITIGGAI